MSDLSATGDLLSAVFPGAGIGEIGYLEWLYRDSPFGEVIQANLDDVEGRAGHYAVVPITMADRGRTVEAALSLNTAVAERARGGGTFTKLAEQAYAAARERGIEIIIGVANANSTPGFVGRLGFTSLGELPAIVWATIPHNQPGWRTANAGTPAADALIASAARSLEPHSPGLERIWTADTLRWRLAAPGRQYLVHRSDEALAISTVHRTGPAKVAVVLAVFTAIPLSGRASRKLQREVAYAHRTPLGTYAGVNTSVALPGRALPRRLRPSPLTLIVRHLGDGPPVAPSRLEFLDFDAF